MQVNLIKALWPAVLAFALILPTSGVQASTNHVNVYFNNHQITFTDAQPYVSHDRTLVPIRAISENMGYTVNWDEGSQTVTVKNTKETVVLTLNSDVANVNGKQVQLDTEAQTQNGRTFVPLRFIAENLGCTVDYKTSRDTLYVFIGDGSVPISMQLPQATGKTYPDGWTAPVLTSSWSSDEHKNFEVFKNELGFGPDGQTYSIPAEPDAIVLYDSESGAGSYEVMFGYSGWTDPQVEASYRVPIISEQLFKFYFGQDYMKVLNYFNNNNIPDQFVANGRTVKVSYNQHDGRLYMKVGFKK